MELNRKQLAYCSEYLIDYNQRQAALRAGYSKQGIDATASRLMKNAKVIEFIDRRKQAILNIADINIERTVRELANICFSNITDFLEVKKNSVELKDWNHLSKDQTACIESVNLTKDGFRLKLFNKITAIEMLGKHLNMFNQEPKDIEEPDQFKDMTNDQLDEFIRRKGNASA